MYIDRSRSSGIVVEDIFNETNSTVERGVKKLTGNQSPDDLLLLRTQSELNQNDKVETAVGETTWGYLKSTAEKFCVRTVGDLIRYIKDLASVDKPFYSRWSNDSPIEFFDYRTRFSYAPIGDFECQDATLEDDPEQLEVDSVFEYWDKHLKKDVLLIANDTTIRTWGDLKGALRGESAYIGESKFSQGTLKRPLREAIRLVPPLE